MTEQTGSTLAAGKGATAGATSDANASAGATASAGGKAALGPFTVRDCVVLASVLVIFVASLLPLTFLAGDYFNIWGAWGIYFIFIGVVLPLIVGALFAIRRLSPATKPRLGSLSVDQFSSVVASFALAFFAISTVTNFQIAYLVGAIGSLALLSATVLALVIPVFAADFAGRSEVPAHTVARDAVTPSRRPAAPKPVLALPAGASAGGFGSSSSASGAENSASDHSGQAGSAGWSANRQQSHTAAGQIFTAAGTAPAGNVTAAVAAAAAQNTAAQSAAAQNPATQAVPASSSVPNATSSQPQAAASQTSEAVSGVVLPDRQQAPETRLNPQLGEPEQESISASVDPHAQPASNANPFWFAVDRPQNVVDERNGKFLYKLSPGAWILALEDRGSSFVVQDGHGKTGVLLDLVGIERAPESE